MSAVAIVFIIVMVLSVLIGLGWYFTRCPSGCSDSWCWLRQCSSCPDGTFVDSKGACSNCAVFCLACTSSACTSCVTGYALDASGNCVVDPNIAQAQAVLSKLLYGSGTSDNPKDNSLKNYMVNNQWAISVQATKYSPSISYVNTNGQTLLTMDGVPTSFVGDLKSAGAKAYAAVLQNINARNNTSFT